MCGRRTGGVHGAQGHRRPEGEKFKDYLISASRCTSCPRTGILVDVPGEKKRSSLQIDGRAAAAAGVSSS